MLFLDLFPRCMQMLTPTDFKVSTPMPFHRPESESESKSPSSKASSIGYVYVRVRNVLDFHFVPALVRREASANIKYSAYLAQIFLYGWYII